MNINKKMLLGAAMVFVVALVGAGVALAGSKGKGGGRNSGRPPMMLPGDDLAAAATYLGISQSTLQSDLQSGKTLAQIADATSGKSASGLIAALVTQEESELQSRVTAMVNGTLPAHGPPPGAPPHA